jgi:hypothetical protein
MDLLKLLQPDKAALITMTCVFLHNLLRKSKISSNYTPLDAFDSEKEGEITLGSWRQDSEGISSLKPLRRMPRSSKPEAKISETILGISILTKEN